jgi:hypothetical protein
MPSKLVAKFAFSLLLLIPLCADAELKAGRYFQAIAGNKAIVRTLWYQSGQKQQSIVATTTMRSGDYAYDAGENIIFYGERVDPEGIPIPEAVVPIPEGASRLLLLFSGLSVPNEQGLTYQVYVIEDDINKFSFGSFHFINASKKDAAINLGGNKFLLKHGATKNVEVEPPKQGDVLIKIAAQNPEDLTWSPYYSNGWGHRDNLRTLVFIIDNQQGGVTTLRYRQFEPAR